MLRPYKSAVEADGELGGAHGAALLETFAAEDRAALGGPERNGGFLAALRARGFGFRADRRSACASSNALGALGFAGFAALGLVLEAFIGEEHLFAGGENELGATLRTLQDLIVVFHEPPPLAPDGQGEGRFLHQGLCG
jgi:hypothetical protein